MKSGFEVTTWRRAGRLAMITAPAMQATGTKSPDREPRHLRTAGPNFLVTWGVSDRGEDMPTFWSRWAASIREGQTPQRHRGAGVVLRWSASPPGRRRPRRPRRPPAPPMPSRGTRWGDRTVRRSRTDRLNWLVNRAAFFLVCRCRPDRGTGPEYGWETPGPRGPGGVRLGLIGTGFVDPRPRSGVPHSNAG